jgi:site-specific recombinase XerC
VVRNTYRLFFSLKDLNYQLKQLSQRNRDGSHGTRAVREHILSLAANQLHELGFRQMQATSLKPKHVEALIHRWQTEGIAVGTLKNRLSALRWWAEKVGKPSVIARENGSYGIPERQYVSRQSKARTVSSEQLTQIRDDHVRMSLALQREFGLRREECMKFSPSFADRGDRLVLKASWTKGGKAREIPILTQSQRAVLERAHGLAGRGSLIPEDRTYVQQLRIYETHTRQAGLSKLHGLRHAYAQRRYEALTGWKAPVVGGPSAKQLSPEQKAIDREARLTISRELGHERASILTVYLGR